MLRVVTGHGQRGSLTTLEIEQRIEQGGRAWLEREITMREAAIRRGTSTGADARGTLSRLTDALLEMRRESVLRCPPAGRERR